MGLAPAYISDLVSDYVPPRTLRSANKALLEMPGAGQFNTEGRMAFTFRAPTLRNALPLEICLTESIPHLKSLLKTHFYRLAFNP